MRSVAGWCFGDGQAGGEAGGRRSWPVSSRLLADIAVPSRRSGSSTLQLCHRNPEHCGKASQPTQHGRTRTISGPGKSLTRRRLGPKRTPAATDRSLSTRALTTTCRPRSTSLTPMLSSAGPHVTASIAILQFAAPQVMRTGPGYKFEISSTSVIRPCTVDEVADPPRPRAAS